MQPELNILFVDDQWCRPEEQSTIRAAFGSLQRRDVPYVFHYETAKNEKGTYSVEPVLRHIQGISNVSAVILDIMFGHERDRLGLEILAAIRKEYPLLPVFMMTSIDGDVDVIEKAMELGANEYLVKKPTLKELETVLRIYTQPSVAEADYALWGNSPAIRHVRALIARVAVSGSASVLITGESGTGKELVARAIHRQGPRRNGLFIDKNCAHERSDLLDSDLFGHEQGAFTGANQKHIGRIERADGGILFLDEISSMPPELQGKLLRVLETKKFQRLGGTETLHSDFQLICATNENPATLIATGRLREDLFFRINQFDIEVPPLRTRIEDIPILAELFLKRFKAGPGASYRAEKFTPGVLEKFKSYSWPGNVREIKSEVERAVMLSRNSVIDIDVLHPEIGKRKAISQGVSAGNSSAISLSDDPASWPRQRMAAELQMAVEAKRRSKSAAEFMRRMYPEHTKTSTAALQDLIRRLTKGPWGDPRLRDDPETARLLDELES